MTDPYWPAPEWKVIGPYSDDCAHLWKQEPRLGGFMENWAYVVTDDFEYYEFRQCVMCGDKQLREPQS